MTHTPNIVPPQPRRRMVMQRVKMRRCLNGAAASGGITLAYLLLCYLGVVAGYPWLVALFMALGAACAALATYFARTEAPIAVEVVEYPLDRRLPIIH